MTITKEKYEKCLRFVDKKFRSKKSPGYFNEDNMFIPKAGYYAMLGGEVVAVSKEDSGISFDEDRGIYYTWEDARKAAYIFRDKCREVVSRYEEQSA